MHLTLVLSSNPYFPPHSILVEYIRLKHDSLNCNTCKNFRTYRDFQYQKSTNVYPILVIMVNALILAKAIDAIVRKVLQEFIATKVICSIITL